MAYIRTCVQHLGEIRRPVRNNCPSSLLIDGVFPDNMKLAKVVPIFKAGDRSVFSKTTDPYPCYHNFQKYWKNYSMKGWISSLTNSNF